MIFDTHAHYDDKAFDEDRDELLQSMRDLGIQTIVNVGASLEGSRRSVLLANKYEHVYAAVGVHPDDAGEINASSLDELKQLALNNPKVVAIGEIGLDYHWDVHDRNIQKDAFASQIALACDLDLPVNIHSRDAALDTMDLLKSVTLPNKGGIMHCFSYSPEIAKEVLDLGLSIGIGGVCTFSNAKKLKEVVANTPLDRIVIETDCPYLAPTPHRGSRNSSLYLPLVIEQIAVLKDLSVEEVENQTYKNACRIYNLPQA